MFCPARYVPAELTLNNVTGLLTWNTNTVNFVNGALYAVQVMLMHINSSGIVDNYAPIDFIIQLSTAITSAPIFVAPSPASGTAISAARFCGTQTFMINATGATPINITAVGLPLSSADLQFSGGGAVAGRNYTTATIAFHPVSALMSTVVTFLATDQQVPAQSSIYSLSFTSTATDMNPPVTTAVTTPTSLILPVTSALFVLSATDDCSGVQSVHYFVDGVLTDSPFATVSFIVTAVGSHNVTFYSTDMAGNNETRHTILFVIGASGVGDPQFVGLRGQSFQVHGLDGAVYAIVSSPSTAINARFVFLTEGRCPIVRGLPAANCWSHPGSYMGEVSVQQVVDGQRHSAVIRSGAAQLGFASVNVDDQTLSVGERVAFGAAFSVQMTSPHSLLVRTLEFELLLGNSDHFINIEQIAPLVPLSALHSHGLLGQTHSARMHSHNTLKHIEGEVDDYLIANGELLGTDFFFNQFQQ